MNADDMNMRELYVSGIEERINQLERENAELIAVLREVDDALPKVYEDDLPLPDNSPRKRMKDVLAKHRGQK